MKTLPHDPTTRVSKDGYASTMTEFEVRQIDAHGDARDVHHYPTKRAALAAAPTMVNAAYPAAAVEKHVTRFLRNGERVVTYTLIATLGDADALHEGGWLEVGK